MWYHLGKVSLLVLFKRAWVGCVTVCVCGGDFEFVNYKWEAELTTAKVCDKACIVEDWTVIQIFCVVPPGEGKSLSRLLFSSAEMFKKPLWQTVWTQIRLLL